MNELFVNVKVDREERPDVDALYMQATLSLAGQGGWPMTVFLTPDGRPFYAGTYFPKTARGGLPAFPDLCRAIAGAYRNRREDVEGQAAEVARRLALASAREPSTEELGPRVLDDAVVGLARIFDPVEGGFGGAPKFPPSLALEFLLRRLWRRPDDHNAREMVERTLGRDGRRRHPRPDRRRLPPLQRGRALAGAPLREDALRQRAAGARLRPRPPADRRRRARARRRGDARLPAARDAGARAARFGRGPGRGLAGRRGRLLRLDARRAGAPAAARAGAGRRPPLRRHRRRATSRAPRSSTSSRRWTPCRASWARTRPRCSTRPARRSTPPAPSARRRPATTRW